MSTRIDKKIEYWEHRLLDLGKRNKMINYRESKRTTLKLVEPSFDALYQRIAINEETLTFQRSVDRETDIRVFSILSLLENLSSPLPVTIGDIKAEGSILERQKTLKNMRSKARLSLEEQGTNILYLSFGFIEWKDGKGASAQWIKSPLILVPAVLTLESLNSPYTLSKHEDDIVVNPTLQYYLKTEYGIDLPSFDPDKDTITGYLDRLEPIADHSGWRILKEVSLGLLSFLKIAMYNDLLRNEERIKINPVIRAMSGDTAEANNIPEELRTFNLDSIKTQDCYQVMSADSSQQDAILYSKNNISFVMQGPPGTGKSQTITNIIAEALASGKKVLFVSEKMAALQVVYRRLQDAHLGDFCLPLHSYKANKKEILEQIGANLHLKQTRVKDAAIQNLEELLAIRQELNQYATELHQLNPELNISCYEVYNKLEEMNDAPTLAFVMTSPLDVTQAQLQAFLNKLKAYALSLQRIDHQIFDNPWDGLTARTTGYAYTEKMRQELSNLFEKLGALSECLSAIHECPQLCGEVIYAQLPELARSMDDICSLPAIPDGWLTAGKLPLLIALAGEAKDQSDRLAALEQNITEVFDSSIYTFDHSNWMSKLLVEASSLVGMPFISEPSPYYYIEHSQQLQQTLSDIRDGLTQANAAFASMNELVGANLTANIPNQTTLCELLAIIRKNEIIVEKWFGEDLAKISATVEEAKTKSTRMLEIKKQLLNHWEPPILELNFEPILLRYKTDYTGIFKIFNSQYRSDKMQLKALSKTVLKKLPDEVAINLLLALKDYHDHAAWFESKRCELESALGPYYEGVNTNWDAVIISLEAALKLKALPAFPISEAFIHTLSTDHAALIDKFAKQLKLSDEAFRQVSNALDGSAVKLDINTAEFSGISAVATIENYLNCFAHIGEHLVEISPFLRNHGICAETIFNAINQLQEHRKLSETLRTTADQRQQQFGFYYRDCQTKWEDILSLLHRLSDVEKLPMSHILNPLILSDSVRKQALKQLSAKIASLHTAAQLSLDWIAAQFEPGRFAGSMSLQGLTNKVKGCLDHLSMLGGWIDYQEAREDCCENGLDSFIEKIEDTKLFTDIERVFLKGFYHMWLGAVCDRSAAVRRFRRNTHDEHIQKFIELDDLQLSIAQMRIREKLIENFPSNHHLLKATDEVAILEKELNKRRNIMPLRKLFKLIPNLLMKLKPCLMMSPLSVSYFLETEAYHFDLVIFDEASQIFPEDAIGAIFRGSQVIIAGDSKQLPPTNFFASSTNNCDGDYDLSGEDDENNTVSDSILEETASVLPNRTLLWHYRSKHESLIAFSNREIYQNSLITFPNSITKLPDMGVEYIYVEDGCYDRGGKKNNVNEAQACVRLVFEHIKNHPHRSLGIIAFSESQQATIENAIIDYRERNPQYEWFFNEANDEPFFIKNLENVQGDERDTIIFSICYGKDKKGTMHMNFGPVGHNGGERRLNVAITRAKCNIKLVGSILPADIDLTKAKTEGARMLRSYIEYAIKGTGVLRTPQNQQAFRTDDDFCKIIVSFLQKHGYEVETEVGCSDYKIDIAIKNPNADGEYIAGIECDGLSYIQARTARDRDHLRRTVLQNMGWNLYRVWSTEWVRNPIAEKTALLGFLQSIVDENGRAGHAVKTANAGSGAMSIDAIASETVKPTQKGTEHNPYGFAYYKEANWRKAPSSKSRDHLTRISEHIRYVVSVEQPIHLDLLYKRLGPSFTAGKATESVKNTINEAISARLSNQVRIDSDQFVRLIPETPVVVRIPERSAAARPMEFIHTEEVATAMLKIIEQSFGITVDALSTECARVFGYERKGPKIKQKTDAAIEYLVTTGKIRIIDGKAQLISS